MSNKKLHLILGFVLAMFVGMIGSFTSAISFNVFFQDGLPVRAGYMRRNMTPIHFKDNGNNFGGFIYFANGVGMDDESEIGEDRYIVQLDQQYECRQKVKGFYYNAERGERLWSLDDSYHMDGVDVYGGFYTRCNQIGFQSAMENCGSGNNEALREKCEEDVRLAYVDSHGYYGMIRHKYGEHTGFVLAAGTNYVKSGSQRIMGGELAPTLIRFDNKYPVGFIYDGNGGVGFLGGKIGDMTKDVEDIFYAFENTAGGDLENLFQPNSEGNGIVPAGLGWINTDKGGSATNSLLSVIVDGLVGINRDTKNTGIQGNQSNDKMQYFSSVNINNMQLINYAKQRAEILCRGKWRSSVDESSKIQCLDGITGTDPIQAKTGWTYIVKNHDVQVKDMNSFNEGNYDIFVYSGNLIIKQVTTDLKVFKNNGFISEMLYDEFSGVKLILNDPYGLYTGDEVVAGKFIKGNFIVDGSVRSSDGSGFDNVYFVYGKMTTKDSVDQLGRVFKRRCKMGIQGTDGTPCPGSEKAQDGTISWINPYENASLVIIDQNYPSPLYQ